MTDAERVATPGSPALIGSSAAMQSVRALIEKLGPTDLPVLVRGPTGAGKELVAQALHRASGRAGRLVALNACAIPEAMFESALFGHVRGAFTGALTDHVGHLADAHRGTLFLDEVGDLPLHVQAKFLRVLETRSYRKVGGRMDETSDFRLIAATNADLEGAIERGSFRADLMYRIGAAVIAIPGLRERPEDIRILADHFARQAQGRVLPLSLDALDLLAGQDWTGNVRQLRHVIVLAGAFAGAGQILRYHVAMALQQSCRPTGAPPYGAVEPTEREADEAALVAILERCRWHVPSAAAVLGVTRKTVYARIRRHGLTIPGRYRRRGHSDAELHQLRVV